MRLKVLKARLNLTTFYRVQLVVKVNTKIALYVDRKGVGFYCQNWRLLYVDIKRSWVDTAAGGLVDLETWVIFCRHKEQYSMSTYKMLVDVKKVDLNTTYAFIGLLLTRTLFILETKLINLESSFPLLEGCMVAKSKFEKAIKVLLKGQNFRWP